MNTILDELEVQAYHAYLTGDRDLALRIMDRYDALEDSQPIQWTCPIEEVEAIVFGGNA